MSPSSRGRGLKYYALYSIDTRKKVALFTRAWIEIDDMTFLKKDYNRRPLHEGVD